MSSPALEIIKLQLRLGSRPVLNDINLKLEPGEFGVLLGENGAGKTSLFTAICGLHHFDHGNISLFGQPQLGTNSEVMQNLGVVFQQPSLDLDLSVEQNLRYAAALQGLNSKQLDQRISESLAHYGLATRRYDTARELNGGHRRRIELIRATLHQPALLLLDEPTVGLDPGARDRFVNEVHALCEEHKTSVLWSTHLIDEVRPRDRVFILHEGQIKTGQSAAELCALYDCDSLIEVFRRVTALASPSAPEMQ